MIEDLFLNPAYWLAVAAVLALAALCARARILSFAFVAIAFASQYVVHSYFAFGAQDEVFWFCLLFLVLLVIGLRPELTTRLIGLTTGRGRVDLATRVTQSSFARKVAAGEGTLVLVAKAYLIIYGVLRIATYPWLGGALDLSARLDASQENRVVFILGLAILPAIAAIATQWVRRGYTLGVIDWIVLALTGVALLTSGSKATIFPAALAIVGATYLAQRPLRSRRFFVIGGAVTVAVAAVGYATAVATAGVAEAARAFLFRLASNSDSLEYLYAIGARPGDYPFAGPGALIPSLAKRLGMTYDFSPGVWLHGERFGQWEGFGPNPGLVLDYFGNIGWFGLIAAVCIGLYCWSATALRGAAGAVFGSITYLALVDVTLFEAAFVIWALIVAGILAVDALLSRKAGRSLSTSAMATRYRRLPLFVRGGQKNTPVV